MSARHARFTFAQDFGPAQPTRRTEDLEEEIARLEARIETARAEGHALGYAAGKADREAVEAARLAEAVEKLAAAGTR